VLIYLQQSRSRLNLPYQEEQHAAFDSPGVRRPLEEQLILEHLLAHNLGHSASAADHNQGYMEEIAED
jgi:hypothetical protein